MLIDNTFMHLTYHSISFVVFVAIITLLFHNCTYNFVDICDILTLYKQIGCNRSLARA